MPDLKMLASGHCKPLRGAEHRVSAARVIDLLRALPGWEVIDDGEAIAKTFRFKDYHQTIAFVNAIAEIANAEDHHPDLSVHYDRCEVRYSTHDVAGCRTTILSVRRRWNRYRCSVRCAHSMVLG